MGLLDDAIREHLDLKRRRGADPAEVARMEQEALGPVRREPVAAEPAAEAARADDAHEREHPEPEPHPAGEAHHADEHTHVLPPEERHDPPHGDPLFHDEHDAELGGAAAREPQHEDHHDDEHDEHVEREDVLEETPEFLQETPEHDRLWFEQRPPRDFDFDG